jgi:uridine kinase
MTFVVGIAGGTGSGKTTLARNLLAALPAGRACLIAHDWYYRDRSHLTPEERHGLNFDEPAALDNALLVKHIEQLHAAECAECPQYDFVTHTRLPHMRRVEPRTVVLVEGILLFSVPELRAAFDLKVFVDTDDDIRLMRRIRRDLDERGRDLPSVEHQYINSVRPMHRLHVEPTRSTADIIVPHGGENAAALQVLQGYLSQIIAGT